MIAFFDGEPTGSVSVPAGQTFKYVYMSHDPGTLHVHCHVEDVEHVQMGMTGLVFVRPQAGHRQLPERQVRLQRRRRLDRFDREYAMFLSEVWAEAHWADAHIQLPEWSDYRADFSLHQRPGLPRHARSQSPIDAVVDTPCLDLQPWRPATWRSRRAGPTLQYQPLSSLVTCNAGRTRRAALRQPRVQGGGDDTHRDADAGRRPRRDPDARTDGTDTSYETEHPDFGAGESFDVIFTAPPHRRTGRRADTTTTCSTTGPTRAPTTSPGGFGGQGTEIHVYPADPAAAAVPNDWGHVMRT